MINFFKKRLKLGIFVDFDRRDFINDEGG